MAPVVEVRDRNNLPVAGATVTFTIGGNSASFAGGVQTLTVATNAAGQAAAAGVSPLASGAVQIQVTAAFQGQTAVATIAQTNVLTAGATGSTGASGASGGSGASGAGGAAAGGGGGISGTTLGIIGAAVAGGAVAATQVGGDGGSEAARPPAFSGTFSGQLLWSFTGCARVHDMSGTLTITLGATEGQVSGTAEINGTSLIASGNCAGGPQAGTSGRLIMAPTPVSGAALNVTFNYQASNSFQDTPTSPPGIHTVTFAFTGTLAGDVINGMLTHGEKAETAGFTPGTGTATYPVTLRR